MARRSRSTIELSGVDGFLGRMLAMVEKNRFNLLTAVLYLISIGIIRSLSESYAGMYPIFGVHLLTQHIMLYFAVFFPGAIAISIIGNIDIKKVLNVQLLGFWINALPAFFDLAIYGRSAELGRGYEFITLDRVLTIRYWLDPVYAIEGTPIAFKTMLLMLPALPALYVAVKWYLRSKEGKREERKLYLVSMVVRGFATFYAVWFVLAWIGALMLFMRMDGPEIVLLNFIRQPILEKYYLGIGPMGDTFFLANEAQFLVVQQRSMMMSLDYILFSLIFLCGVMYLWKKGSISLLLKDLRPLFLLLVGAFYLLGIVMARTLYPTYIFHWPYIVFGYFLFVLIWEAVRVIDIGRKPPVEEKKGRKKRRKKDKPEENIRTILGEDTFKLMAPTFMVFAIILAFNLGPLSFVMIALLLLLGYLWLRFDAGSSIRCAISALLGPLAFLNGMITPSMWYLKEWTINLATLLPANLTTVVYYRHISFSGPELIILISIFLISFALNLLWNGIFDHPSPYVDPPSSAPFILFGGMVLPLIVFTDILDILVITSLSIVSFILLSRMVASPSMDKENGSGRRPTMSILLIPILVWLEIIFLVIKSLILYGML